MSRINVFVCGFILSYLFMVAVSCFNSDYIDKYINNPATVFKYVAILLEKPHVNEWWYLPEETDKKGVTINIPDKTWGDYTLFGRPDQKVFLVNMEGEKVYEWDASMPQGELSYINDTASLMRVFSDPADYRNIYVVYFSNKDIMFEYGISKIDGDSNMLWYSGRGLTHDVAFTDQDNFLTIRVKWRETDHPAIHHLSAPYIENFVVFMNSDGKIAKEISLLDAFADTEYQEGVLDNLELVPDDPNYRAGDFFHPNTVTIVPPEVAEKFPKIASNSVMLSFRNLDMLVFLDLDTEKVTWAFYGPWRGQHSPRFLENGNIVMFDNQGNLGEGGSTRIIEVNLEDQGIVWEYTGDAEHPLYSVYNGIIDILPNGNLLVTEVHSGRIFEVTRDKELVWEYYAKDRVEYDGETRIPSLLNAKRFAREEVESLLAAQ